MSVMARNGYEEMSVGDVLSEAGLSTRAFYRHFDSKEALLLALVIRDTESVVRSLERAISRAPDPIAALEAWIDGYLDVFYEPKRSARTALFRSPAVHASLPLVEAHPRMRRILCAPLVQVLCAGHESGALHSPIPETDAATIAALISATRDPAQGQPLDRAATRAHVRRFAWPALGLPTGDQS